MWYQTVLFPSNEHGCLSQVLCCSISYHHSRLMQCTSCPPCRPSQWKYVMNMSRVAYVHPILWDLHNLDDLLSTVTAAAAAGVLALLCEPKTHCTTVSNAHLHRDTSIGKFTPVSLEGFPHDNLMKRTLTGGSYNLTLYLATSITAPQDAHKRLVMQVAEWLTASLYQCSREVSDMSWLHNL